MFTRYLHRGHDGRRATIPTLALAAGVVTTIAATTMVVSAPQADALAKIKCKQTTGTGNYDPIMAHNEKSSPHMHQFFGNNNFLSLSNPNTATLSDLEGHGTNCRNPADTAGYWTPVLQDKSSGAMIPTQAFTAYYRSWDFQKQGEGEPFPIDTRLVGTKHDWTCGNLESQKPVQTIPDCSGVSGKPGHTLTAHIDFPSCWDGVLPNHSPGDVGATDDNKHYAYRTGESCPAGFPHKMISLRETLQFQYTGAGNDVQLSSDPMAGTTDGASLHADFWNAWDPKGLQSMVNDCIATGGNQNVAECG